MAAINYNNEGTEHRHQLVDFMTPSRWQCITTSATAIMAGLASAWTTTAITAASAAALAAAIPPARTL
ncbi:hypothetical protein FZEAL_8388 [Fusarium zealandicum]|uniref:Uncharacterized protein n=1 Tax=Fusarium zealandicum TaxID=1053134 RepID=A0A8H4UEX9_9HYPO|nr:hypothetical protein FZEAL_8388 [Fusarium zealandicum]